MPDGDKNDPHLLITADAPEALLVCPECAAPLAAGAYEAHLRHTHRLYFFRGVRHSYNDVFISLLNLLAGPKPDAEAWRVLSVIVREDHGPRAARFLAATLGGLLARVEGDRRDAAVEALADLLAAEGDARLTAALAADDEVPARRLALALLSRRPPGDRRLARTLRRLLLDRRLPEEAQFTALAALMRSAGPDDPAVAKSLRRLVGGLGKAAAVERLRRFERGRGKAPAIDALCAELEERVRMNCPRCPARLRRPAMVRHLWDEHRLVLDGRRVREPWAIVEDWIGEYCHKHDTDLLERCRVRGPQLDPADGLHRVHRLLLRAGVADPEARRDLIGLARERHASLCPSCYALAPMPREAPPAQINLRSGRLSAGGYVVETSSQGIFTTPQARIPGRPTFHCREGRWGWTRRGATLFLVGPFVAAALAAAVAWDGGDWGPIALVAALTAAALLTLGVVRRTWAVGGAPPERLLRHAWTLLAPRLHENGFVPEDSAFLAGLAHATPAGAFRQRRAPLLASLLKRTEDAVAAGLAAPGHLAALRRLMVADAAAAGADPVPLVVDQLARCFEGRLPLAYAQHLLAGWTADWWTRGNLVRLRVLLCDRAFEAGFEVRNLLDAGRTAPALGELLGVGDPAGLAALRLLWSERPTRPWDPCGPSQTVFDLAADPAHADLLGRHPDLLLCQREPSWVVAADGGEGPMRAAEILFGVGGVWLQDVRFTEAPAVVEEARKAFGFELALGKRRFRGPGEVDALARRMERWFRFAFHDFLPRTVNVHTWQSPERGAILRAWGAAPCPECGQFFLARSGAVGVALDETARPGDRLTSGH